MILGIDDMLDQKPCVPPSQVRHLFHNSQQTKKLIYFLRQRLERSLVVSIWRSSLSGEVGHLDSFPVLVYA